MRKYIATAALVGALATLPALGAEHEGAAKDAWLTGKIETVYALNPHLNGFKIDTDVMKGAVHLTGKVESAIDRDLAGELAKGIDGVVSVDNDLTVDQQARTPTKNGEERPFSVWVDDATTTAMVKSKLVANGNTHGLKIDVDTRGDVVTLSGQVPSSEEKQLAEEIARNTGDVKGVHNQLVVSRNN
jgi:hyperosmotically inducible periplasmic protein